MTGDQKATLKAYEAVVKEFRKRNLGNKTRAAYFAAKAEFLRAANVFARYDAKRLGDNPKRLKDELEAKARMEREVVKAYEEVIKYKQPEWTVAALYQIAFAKQRFADVLFVERWPEESRLGDRTQEYHSCILDDVGAPIEEAAVELYKKALNASTEMRVFNEWTMKILLALNRLRPSLYPFQKDAKGLLDRNAVTAPGWDSSADKVKDAEKAAIAVLRTNGNNTTAMIDLAKVYLAQKRFELLEWILENATEGDAKHPMIFVIRGHAVLDTGDRAAAVEMFKKTVEIKDDLPEVHNNLGYLFAEVRDFPAAIGHLNKAIFQWPDYTAARLNLGNALRGNKQYDESLAEYKQVLAAQGHGPDVLFNLGILHLDMEREFKDVPRLDRFKTAKEYLEKFGASPGLSADDAARVDGYIKEAEKRIKQAETDVEREKRRKARAEEERRRKQAEESKKKAEGK